MAPDNNPSRTSHAPTGGGSGTSAMDIDIEDINSDLCNVEEKAPPSWFERVFEAVMRAIGMRDAARKRTDEERCLGDPDHPGGSGHPY